MTAQEAAKLAQQAAALEESRKAEREAKSKPKASTAKPKASTKSEPDLSGFDFFTRPQYAVLRSALRRSEAKLVGQQRLDDGTMVYVALDKDGKVVRQGRIDPGVDYPSKGSSN